MSLNITFNPEYGSYRSVETLHFSLNNPRLWEQGWNISKIKNFVNITKPPAKCNSGGHYTFVFVSGDKTFNHTEFVTIKSTYELWWILRHRFYFRGLYLISFKLSFGTSRFSFFKSSRGYSIPGNEYFFKDQYTLVSLGLIEVLWSCNACTLRLWYTCFDEFQSKLNLREKISYM